MPKYANFRKYAKRLYLTAKRFKICKICIFWPNLATLVTERNITRPTLVALHEWLRRHVAAGRVAVNQTGHKPLPRVEVNTPIQGM